MTRRNVAELRTEITASRDLVGSVEASVRCAVLLEAAERVHEVKHKTFHPTQVKLDVADWLRNMAGEAKP